MFLNDVDSQRWTLMGTVIKLVQSVSAVHPSIVNEAATDRPSLNRSDFVSFHPISPK